MAPRVDNNRHPYASRFPSGENGTLDWFVPFSFCFAQPELSSEAKWLRRCQQSWCHYRAERNLELRSLCILVKQPPIRCRSDGTLEAILSSSIGFVFDG